MESFVGKFRGLEWNDQRYFGEQKDGETK